MRSTRSPQRFLSRDAMNRGCAEGLPAGPGIHVRLTLLLVVFLLFSGPAIALAQHDEGAASSGVESSPEQHVSANWATPEDESRAFARFQRNLGITLGTWAVANIAVGAVGWSQSEGRTRAFHQMNLGWNTVNLAIAATSLLGQLGGPELYASYGELVRARTGTEKILLLNAGLDVGYLTLAAFLRERGLRRDDDRLVGFGNSIFLQGAFLLAFDVTLLLISGRQTSRLWEQVGVSTLLDSAAQPAGLALSLVW